MPQGEWLVTAKNSGATGYASAWQVGSPQMVAPVEPVSHHTAVETELAHERG